MTVIYNTMKNYIAIIEISRISVVAKDSMICICTPIEGDETDI